MSSLSSKQSVQFSPLTDWIVGEVCVCVGGGGGPRDTSGEVLFQSFLREAIVRSSGIGRDVHSLRLSIQHFLCLPRRRLPSNVP